MENVFDVLKKAKRLEKEYKNGVYKPSIKIAVIGTIAIQHFVLVLRYQLHNCGIISDIYEGEYDGIAMDVFQENSALYQFKPDIVIILCHYMDIKVFPQVLDTDNEIDKMVDDVVSFYHNVWNSINGRMNCTILQSNYVIPLERQYGNIEKKVPYSKHSYINKINDSMNSNTFNDVVIIDVDTVSNVVGKRNWFDPSAYFLSKMGCRLDYLSDYCMAFTSAITNQLGKVRKCLVLDLDNTLWGDVVGDVGYDGVQIDPNNAVGEAYRYFQKYIKELKNRGVLLAICSKNDEAIAKEVFIKNEKMILKLDDFSCFLANWDDKATNIKKIAEMLNIGVDSMVFFDDNPAERDIVRTFLPDVWVVDVPEDPANYVKQLDYEQPFNWLNITKEDILRSDSYIENSKRVELMHSFVDYNEYLKALTMEAECGVLSRKDADRFTQLINKSNQFNLRTQRYSESQILSFLEDPQRECIYVKLRDKYSDYGLISCIILTYNEGEAFIDSWVMSCRVLKRGVELLAFKHIVENCRLHGCETIRGEYIPSKKNAMVKDLYSSFGFSLILESENSNQYVYNVNEYSIGDCCFITEKESE